jgi:ankyrin repeat protein
MTLPGSDPRAIELVLAVQGGDLAALRGLLTAHPGLVNARIAGRGRGRFRTPLHLATDWPGYFPNAPAAVRLLTAAGADPNTRTKGNEGETPLHWAASSDDVEVAAALIDAGADIEAPDGSIGTPLANAIGYACWDVARLLVARGARVEALWQAAALGDWARLGELFGADPAPSSEDINHAFWQACHGGQLRVADYLLSRGADINTSPDYADETPIEIAAETGTRREALVTWLREHGAASDGAASDGASSDGATARQESEP